MHQGKPIQEFASELVRQAKTKRDYLAPTRTLTLERQPNNAFGLGFGGLGPFPMRNLAHDQLQEFVNIPRAYYDRMRTEAPELLITNVQNWLQKSDTQRMVRTLDGDARAFLSDRYRPLDNVDLFYAVVEPLRQAEVKIDSCELTETRLYIKCTTSKITIQPKLGDIIEAGILIQNSEVGMGRLVVGPFLKRLACMNGMVIDDFATKRTHVGKRSGRRASVTMAAQLEASSNIPEEWLRDETRVADDKAFFMTVQDVVRASFNPEKFEQIAAKITGAAARPLDGDPVKMVKMLGNSYALNEDETSGVLQHLIQGGDLSQWGLANAVTALAGKVKDYDRSTELERAGGEIIELADNDWEGMLKESKKAA